MRALFASLVVIGLLAGLTAAPASASAAVSLAPAPSAATPDDVTAPTPTPTAEVDEGDPIRNAEYWLDDYGVAEAWETTRGAGVRIAIIDTGIARGPEEFAGAVVGGTDVSGVGTPDGRTPVGAVDADHGSWVASLAAARGTGPDEGMIGVAPEAELLSISVGFGSTAQVPFSQQIAEAIVWAVDNGADVINLSFTTNGTTWDESWDDAFMYAFDHDVVMIVAAGNRGSGTTKVGAPATIPGVLTVGGVDPYGRASVGASTQGITIGVSAPSERLIGVSPDGTLVWWDGTSGAAPIVAGIAALVRAAHPELDANNVINRIVSTATPSTFATADPDPLYGYGLVDAARAVSAPVAEVDSNPMGSLSDWIRLYRRADSSPVPSEAAQPAVVPELPPIENVTTAASPLLPTYATVLYGTVPLVLVTASAILVALGVTAAVRRIRSANSSPRR
ncbi:S8 family serine peptidase [Microbacterium sp. C7(2022)]|uniref:S8 family serine peptidase n=1 Tax=Microbacterium sp. C7(2022) TaxID=2992759 RepID=UPI0027D21865|nr:S8 family serine peptidase [Microbacterium sp. C7(2022)]